MVRSSKQTALLACRNRTTEVYFLSRENKRVGDQTKLFDEKVLVEGDKATADPTHFFTRKLCVTNKYKSRHNIYDDFCIYCPNYCFLRNLTSLSIRFFKEASS